MEAARQGNISNYLDAIKTDPDTYLKHTDSDGNTALHILVSNDSDKQNALKLIEFGSSLKAVNEEGCTPLHIAILKKREYATVMIKKDPEAARMLAPEKKTALHLAIEAGNSDVAKFLLANPPYLGDINARDEEGATALHKAFSSFQPSELSKVVDEWDGHQTVSYDNPKKDASDQWLIFVIQELLKCTVIDPNAQDEKGNTPLHWAAKSDCYAPLEAVKALLKYQDVDPLVKNTKGKRASQMNKYKSRITDYLQEIEKRREKGLPSKTDALLDLFGTKR